MKVKLKKSKWGSGPDRSKDIELYTATWACPECGLTFPIVYDDEEINVEDVIEICLRCGSEMNYITDEEFEEGIKKWIRRVKENNEV